MTGHRIEAVPVATSIGGYVLVYLLAPLIVVSIASGFAAVAHVSRRLTVVEQGLAILVQQVSPPGSVALRDLVQNQAVEIAELRGLVTANLSPQPSTATHTPRPEGRH